MATKNEIEKPKVRLMEVVLNKFLKKYDWFKKIEIESIGYSEGAEGHFAIDGTIFVDEDWLYNQWREYNYSAPFPDLNDKDLGDFVGGDLSKKLRDEFIMLFVAVTELKKPRYISWSWIKIRTEEDNQFENTQKITNIIKEEINTDLANKLRDLVSNFGLQRVYDMVGGPKNYLKLVYDGNLKEFFKEEKIEPFKITPSPTVGANMYINDMLVTSLNLSYNESRKEKKLGSFKYGNKNNMIYSVNARLISVNYLDTNTVGWRVAAIGGTKGFGYAFIPSNEVLGNKYRKQIFDQIIEKYNLNDYL